MSKLYKAVIILFLSFNLLPLTNSFAGNVDVCPQLGKLATNIMRSRQSGRSISSLIKLILPYKTSDNSTYKAMKGIILIAYGMPRWYTNEMQQESIEDFRNKIELACYGGS